MATGNYSYNYVFDDSKRPTLPYIAGATFEIKRHKPLTPFDSGICYAYPAEFSLAEPLLPSDVLTPSDISNPDDHWTPWSWSPSDPSQVPPDTITERYLRHRPRKTEPCDGDSRVHQLEIVRQIRARDGAYAQVVQCHVNGIQGPLVAKIFDPLYRWEDVELDEPWSPVGLTESEWSCEAAAYIRIQDRGLDGRYTPRFEGCWSFDIPYELELEPDLAGNSAAGQTGVVAATTTTTDGGPQSNVDRGIREQQLSKRPECRTFKTTRNVRLLLMEYIPGDSIIQLLHTGAYQGIPPNIRMDLLGNIAEAQSALWHIRVSHGDPHSRNVVVARYEEHDRIKGDEEDGKDANGGERKRHQSSASASSPERIGERPKKRQKRRGLDSRKWRVVLVDFGKSVVLDLPNATSNLKGRISPALPLPPNPMTRCRGSWPIYPLFLEPDWDSDAPREDNWVHDDYQSFKARREWMEARWGKDSARAKQYQPVEYAKLDERRSSEK